MDNSFVDSFERVCSRTTQNGACLYSRRAQVAVGGGRKLFKKNDAMRLTKQKARGASW